MVQAIYPQEIRENDFSSIYAEIAMESFYCALRKYEEIKANNFLVSSMWELGEMDKQAISAVVFSAMCVEAFLNNYAAACLGDAEYYENFDRLSAIGKFQLIAKFVLKTDIEKHKAYYSLFKQLFRNRDAYVHNKSRRSKYQGMTEEELAAYDLYKQSLGEEVYAEPDFPQERVEQSIREARDALKAVREVAEFFDERDSRANAVQKLFCPQGAIWGHDTERRYKQAVFPLIGIKVDKQHEV